MLTASEPKNEVTRLIVDRLWCVSDPAADGQETRLPSGRAQIIFSLSGTPLREVDAAHPNWRPLELFQGPTTVSQRISRKPHVSACGISFQPGGAGALFGPINDTVDRLIDLADFWGNEAVRIRRELQSLQTHQARLDRLEAEIQRRILDTSAVRVLARAIEHLVAGTAIKDICKELKLSPHAFRQLFRSNVGVCPKLYLRIERFRTMVTQMEPTASLSDLAFQTHYSDQPHMTREVRHFASMTPARLRASVRPHAGHVRGT